MQNIKKLLLVLFSVIITGVYAQIKDPVKFKLEVNKLGENEYEAILVGKLENGWHIYSKDIPDERIALAHLSLPLIGEGEVCIQNKIYSAQELASKYGWEPLPLSQREVDALLNGTQLTTAYSAYNLIESLKLIEWADFVASVSTQVFGGNLSAFSELMQVVRPHKGLVETAQHLRTLLKDSTLVDSPEDFQSIVAQLKKYF